MKPSIIIFSAIAVVLLIGAVAFFFAKDYFLKTAYSGSNALQRIVPAEDKSGLFKVTDSSEYIYPFLLCIDTLKKVFVFGHHTTTDRLDFIIEAKDFNFKTIWKKSSAQLLFLNRGNQRAGRIAHVGQLDFFWLHFQVESRRREWEKAKA